MSQNEKIAEMNKKVADFHKELYTLIDYDKEIPVIAYHEDFGGMMELMEIIMNGITNPTIP